MKVMDVNLNISLDDKDNFKQVLGDAVVGFMERNETVYISILLAETEDGSFRLRIDDYE